MAPPPGPHAPGVLVPQWLLIVLSLLALVAQFNLRTTQRMSPLTSDYLMLCAWLAAVATASFDIIFARLDVLHPDMDYFLTKYSGTPEDVEYILKVGAAPPTPEGLTAR